MNSTNTQFKNARGLSLAARLDSPPTPRGYALFAHCFTCSKNLTAVRYIVHGLIERGIAVFSFDFTGLGASEGQFVDSDFSGQTSDLICAANFINQSYGVTPAILIGHSLGGTAALYAARKLPQLKGVVTIGSPSDPAYVTNLFCYTNEELAGGNAVEVDISGRHFTITKEFVDDLHDYPPAKWLHEIQQDVLILHSPVDKIVDIQNAEQIFVGVRHPKSFVSLDRADHMISQRADADFVAAVISGWADRHFEPSIITANNKADSNSSIKSGVEGPPQYNPPLKEDYQVVARVGERSFSTNIQTADHYHYADEPKKLGGEERGPTPFQHLLGALGSCTVMTLRLYARRKQWPLKEARAYLHYFSEPEKIQLRLELIGALEEAQRQRLLEIADRCPIHKVLSRSLEIDSALV